MEKSPDAFRTISEVADWLGVQAHVLRFWESKFSQIKPLKRAGGRRYYRPADMELLAGIRKLLHEDGMTIKGTQKLLREHGVTYVASLGRASVTDVDLNMSELTDAADQTPDRPDALSQEVASTPDKSDTRSETGDMPGAPEPPQADLFTPHDMTASEPKTEYTATVANVALEELHASDGNLGEISDISADEPEAEPVTDDSNAEMDNLTQDVAEDPVTESVVDPALAPTAPDSVTELPSFAHESAPQDSERAPHAAATLPDLLPELTETDLVVGPGLLAQSLKIHTIPQHHQDDMREVLAELRRFADALTEDAVSG